MLDRAALLAKADLESLMVGEFSELQGIMGREYALLAGENPVIASAIYEHYYQLSPAANCRKLMKARLSALADKIDTIVVFSVSDYRQTGTADPYALRRQSLGVINIILDKRYPLTLDLLIDEKHCFI